MNMTYIALGLTIVFNSYILYIIGKDKRHSVNKKLILDIEFRQSFIHEMIRPFLPSNKDIINTIRNQEVNLPQSKQRYSEDSIKVIVVDDIAYWIQDDKFYCTPLDEDGEVDSRSALPVDTTAMTEEELAVILKVVDELRGFTKNDDSSSGNE